MIEINGQTSINPEAIESMEKGVGYDYARLIMVSGNKIGISSDVYYQVIGYFHKKEEAK